MILVISKLKFNRLMLGVLIVFFLLLLNSYYFLSHEQYREYLGSEAAVCGAGFIGSNLAEERAYRK